ncbi:MAG: YfhO family protein [Deltaproteobacteria bacterium]|nr:YfhO family protein [Deltaproteobacteria bacterium]
MVIFLVTLFFTLLAGGYFSSALDGTRLLTERDLAVFFIPPRILWTDMIRHGEFPLWNPYAYSGSPLLATLQPGVLYPPNLLLVLMPFDLAFNWLIIIHFIMAGVFTFLLLRELRAGIAASIIGGLTFMLGGYLFSTHNVMSTLFSAAWAPIALFVFLRSIRRASYRLAVITGCVLAVMFMGGGIETVIGTCGLLTFLALMPTAIDTEVDAAPFAPVSKRLALLACAAAIFLLLAAVQLLPFIELARLSTRAGGLSYQEATTWSFDLKDFAQFFVPDPFGYGVSSAKYWGNQSWLKTIYLGPIPFILSFFFLSDPRRKVLPFVLLAALSMTLALGRNSAIYALLYAWFPVFGKLRFPVKFLFLAFLLVSISAGLGYDSFISNRARLGRPVIVILALSFFAAIAFGGLYHFENEARGFLIGRGIDYPEYNRAGINLFNAKRLLFFTIAASIIIYGAWKTPRLARALPYLLTALLTIDLFFAHQGYYQTTLASEYHRSGGIMEFLKKDPELARAFVTPKTMTGNLDAVDVKQIARFTRERMNLDKEKLQGYNLEHRVFDTTGVEVMQRADYSAFYDLIRLQKRPDETQLLSLLNVKYVISAPKIASRRYRLVRAAGSIKVYENTAHTPRFYTVGAWRVIKDRQAYMNALLDKGFSPMQEALLEEEPFAGGTPASADAPRDEAVKVVSYRNDSIELSVRRSTPGLLVASETWYPGWTAYVDGVETKVLKADYIIRAVPVGRGGHAVRLAYRPWTFRVGGAASGLTLAGVVAYLAAGRRMGKGRDAQ